MFICVQALEALSEKDYTQLEGPMLQSTQNGNMSSTLFLGSSLGALSSANTWKPMQKDCKRQGATQ
jgi:hypothetical protein